MNFFKSLIKFLKKLLHIKPEPTPPTPPDPVEASDKFLEEIEKASSESDKKPDRIKVKFEFEKGEEITFEIRNVAEVWIGGYVKRTNGVGGGFNPNTELRHRVLAVMGENNARNLGGNQTRRGEPLMPIVPLENAYYWTTANNKRMYELNNANVYTIRVVELLKNELGITSPMTKASGIVTSWIN